MGSVMNSERLLRRMPGRVSARISVRMCAKIVRGAVLLMTVLLQAGCYEGDPSAFEAAVIVGREQVTALNVTGATPIIEVGAVWQLAAVATTATGTTDLSGEVVWSSSNPEFLHVDGNGLVTGVADGSADITATLAQFSGTVTMTASSAALTNITVSGAAGVDECGTGDYTAAGTYADTTNRDITTLVTWSVTDAAVARMSTLPVDRNRLLSLQAGTTGVVATRGSIVSPEFVVTVADNLTAIDVTPNTPAQIADGATVQFIATGSWGTNSGNISRATVWSVAPAEIATVQNGDSNPGLLTAQSGGAAVLTGGCGGLNDTVNITVIFLETLDITNVDPIKIVPNANLLLVLEGTWSNGTKSPLNESATWSTTLTSGTPVTVSNTAGTRGRVTAGSAAGVSVVRAVVDGKEVSVTVTVE